MTEDRKSEEFDIDTKEWKVFFDTNNNTPGREGMIEVRFRLNRNGNPYFSEKDIPKLKQDIKDLGKLRIIKQGKGFLST